MGFLSGREARVREVIVAGDVGGSWKNDGWGMSELKLVIARAIYIVGKDSSGSEMWG